MMLSTGAGARMGNRRRCRRRRPAGNGSLRQGGLPVLDRGAAPGLRRAESGTAGTASSEQQDELPSARNAGSASASMLLLVTELKARATAARVDWNVRRCKRRRRRTRAADWTGPTLMRLRV